MPTVIDHDAATPEKSSPTTVAPARPAEEDRERRAADTPSAVYGALNTTQSRTRAECCGSTVYDSHQRMLTVVCL
ncbi:hypothetical protein ACFWM1_30645 [Nocardia sp. NPDC058379]|uniref:hypothetical protein n=1 Tax=unclassified Nocardia TaxID=2637762 RepID=UPI00364C96F9